MKIVFFIVHPSKFHLFKNTINYLKGEGINVDVYITSKDVLEELVKSEGWKYKNIFPEGRKINGVNTIISSIINYIRTIYRLYKNLKNGKYDLFITDDLLVYLGKYLDVPSIVFLDDDINTVKPFSLILSKATYILAPDITDVGKFEKKKIAFPSYKELAYLHPNNFSPKYGIIKKFNPNEDPYFIVRLVALEAYHDVGKHGISNKQLNELINLLQNYGRVFITSERQLPNRFEKYRLRIEPRDMPHVLYYAKLFIGDSQTMCSEASVLGTPTFRCNDFVGKINVMNDKDNYGIMFSYRPKEFDKMIQDINQNIKSKEFYNEVEQRKIKMLDDKIDLAKYLNWLLINFPQSIQQKNNCSFKFDEFKSIK